MNIFHSGHIAKNAKFAKLMIFRYELLKTTEFAKLKTDVSPRSSPLGYVSRRRTSATQQQKFHTDDVRDVRNPVINNKICKINDFLR